MKIKIPEALDLFYETNISFDKKLEESLIEKNPLDFDNCLENNDYNNSTDLYHIRCSYIGTNMMRHEEGVCMHCDYEIASEKYNLKLEKDRKNGIPVSDFDCIEYWDFYPEWIEKNNLKKKQNKSI